MNKYLQSTSKDLQRISCFHYFFQKTRNCSSAHKITNKNRLYLINTVILPSNISNSMIYLLPLKNNSCYIERKNVFLLYYFPFIQNNMKRMVWLIVTLKLFALYFQFICFSPVVHKGNTQLTLRHSLSYCVANAFSMDTDFTSILYNNIHRTITFSLYPIYMCIHTKTT